MSRSSSEESDAAAHDEDAAPCSGELYVSISAVYVHTNDARSSSSSTDSDMYTIIDQMTSAVVSVQVGVFSYIHCINSTPTQPPPLQVSNVVPDTSIIAAVVDANTIETFQRLSCASC